MCEQIDAKEWLKSNKLLDIYDVFQSRNITIEEITDFSEDDIKLFAKDTLKLDVLAQKRFIKAIQKIKYKNKQPPQSMIRPQRHKVIISSAEQQGLTKLYEQFDKCSQLQISIQKALQPSNENNNTLNQYHVKSVNDINAIFDEIIKQLLIKKDELLQNVNDIHDNKTKQLNEQLNILETEYISLIKDGKAQYELYSKGMNTKLNILSMVNAVLSFNNKPISTTVVVTQPKINFNIDDSIKLADTLLNKFKIDDCDKALPVQIKIHKVTSNAITITYGIQKKYYIKIGKPILKICIQYALIKNDKQLWQYDEKKAPNDTDSDNSDSEDENSTSNTSDSSISDDNSDSESTPSHESKSSDEGDEFATKKPVKKLKKKQQKKKKKRKRKKKRKKKKDKKWKMPRAKIKFIDVSLIKNYNELKWFSVECKISKKDKKYDEKLKIEDNIKNNKTYIVRMKLLNESGWSDYYNNDLKSLYIVKTPNIIIDSKILTLKEKVKLKQMVDKQTKNKFNKWKLLYKGSRDGFYATAFHSKCDAKPNTICIIETVSNNVFGGYTSSSWNGSISNYVEVSDRKAFLYLIRSSAKHKPEIYVVNPTKANQAIRNQKNFYLMFGSASDMYLSDSCNSGGNYIANNLTYYPVPANYYLNGGQASFRVQEVEVFHLKK